MFPRLTATSALRRMQNTVAATALALGLAASVLAPSAAFAQASGPDLDIKFVPGDTFKTGQVGSKTFSVLNKGDLVAKTVQVRIEFNSGFEAPTVAPVDGQAWQCDAPTTSPRTGNPVFVCTTDLIEPGASSEFVASATIFPDVNGTFWVQVDPKDIVQESEERNNTSGFGVNRTK